MKKSYEVVWEIFNECANNQMRDIFIEEIETEDTDAWIRSKVKDQELTWEKHIEESECLCYNEGTAIENGK